MVYKIFGLSLSLLLSTLDIRAQYPVINEFMASNATTLADHDGDFPDWIEIYNPHNVEIKLNGWSITDNRLNLKKWTFPDVSVSPNEYLIVFASGKNRCNKNEELHTNFSLSSSGEYLALTDNKGNKVTEFSPFYPAQEIDISYGLVNGTYSRIIYPTPGSKNNSNINSTVSEPIFSSKHGTYRTSFELTLKSGSSTDEIYFTSDGSEPDRLTGMKYSGPLLIDSTCVVRACSYGNDGKRSRVVTNSYIFPYHIVKQPKVISGYPEYWGLYTGIAGRAIADYEMDPELVSDPTTGLRIAESLFLIPTISLSTNKSNLFSAVSHPDSGGIYIYTGAPLTNTTNDIGFGWERASSFEFFDSADSVSVQADCALQLHGGHSRRAEKSPKHSLRLEFKSKFGPSKLEFPIFGSGGQEEFNSIVLRAGFNNSWIHHSNSERLNGQYIADPWVKNTHRKMGNPGSRSFFTHLYINGLYWGIYTVAERIDDDFAEVYFGGDGADYDIIKDYTEVDQGDILAWNKMMNMAKAGLSANETYQAIQGKNPDGTRNFKSDALVHTVSLIDYMLLNFFVANNDWDHHNWLAIRDRSRAGDGFRFFCWDEEKVLESLNANILNENNPNCPSYLFQRLRQNAEFRRLFADRAQKFLSYGGVLSSSENIKRYTQLASQVFEPLWAESARWGDYRRDVHPYQTAGPFDLYTPDNQWSMAFNYTVNTYFVQRSDIFLAQLKLAGLLPSSEAPYFKINRIRCGNSVVLKGDTLEIVSNGDTWFTTDGDDPVNWNLSASIAQRARKYSGKIVISESGVYRARTYSGGVWSASSEIEVSVKEDLNNLKITEINYHPEETIWSDRKSFEFIEIKNTGNSTLAIDSARLSGGIEYMFPAESVLKPGKFFVIAANRDSFLTENEFIPHGEFSGSLSNQGESIYLIAANGDTIINIKYSGQDGWPIPPNGEGNTLVPREINPLGSQNNLLEWRSSYHSGGSPGADDIFNASRIDKGVDAGPMTLYQNYPNPFFSSTWIPFRLESSCQYEISINDITGQKIHIIEKSFNNAGDYAVEWNGRTDAGAADPGVYIVVLTVNSNGKLYSARKKILISGK